MRVCVHVYELEGEQTLTPLLLVMLLADSASKWTGTALHALDAAEAEEKLLEARAQNMFTNTENVQSCK